MTENKEMEESRSLRKWRNHARREVLGLPQYTVAEEILNAVTHGAGALLSAFGLVVLLLNCRHDALTVTSVSVFGGSMILLYLISTVYHGLGVNRGKRVMRTLDHCTIFLLIAGTYTPISLLCFGGTTRWVLFGIVWGTALLGIALNAVSVERFRVFSMICYLGLGWIVVFFLGPLLSRLDGAAVFDLIAGGVCYTLGAALYGVGKKVRYMHAVFHLFVLAGSVFHYFVVFGIAV